MSNLLSPEIILAPTGPTQTEGEPPPLLDMTTIGSRVISSLNQLRKGDTVIGYRITDILDNPKIHSDDKFLTILHAMPQISQEIDDMQIDGEKSPETFRLDLALAQILLAMNDPKRVDSETLRTTQLYIVKWCTPYFFSNEVYPHSALAHEYVCTRIHDSDQQVIQFMLPHFYGAAIGSTAIIPITFDKAGTVTKTDSGNWISLGIPSNLANVAYDFFEAILKKDITLPDSPIATSVDNAISQFLLDIKAVHRFYQSLDNGTLELLQRSTIMSQMLLENLDTMRQHIPCEKIEDLYHKFQPWMQSV